MSTETSFSFLVSETANNKFVKEILEQQLRDAGASVVLKEVAVRGGELVVIWDGLATPADEVLTQATVAAHTGDDFGDTTQKALSIGAASDDTGSLVSKCDLNTGPLPAGGYILGWHANLAVTDDSNDNVCTGVLHVTINGVLSTVQPKGLGTKLQPACMSGSFPLDLVDGDVVEMDMMFARVGVAGNAAICECAWVTIQKVS